MFLKQIIQEDLKNAVRAKDEITSLVLRGLNSEINNKAIELGKKEGGLNEEEIQQVILREIKKRQDAIEQYKRGGREDLAENEEREMEILQKYAHEQMNKEELYNLIDEAIEETGASSTQDTGRVIGAVMQKAGTAADGITVSRLVREKLQND
jgi:uncharacterized protein YqeY